MAKEIQYAPFKDGGGYPFPVDDVQLKVKDTYLGNTLVKRGQVKHDLTIAQIQEITKCAMDPIYFIETYCRIVSIDDGIVPFRLFDYQKEMIDMYMNNRFCLTLTARQMGKCLRLNTPVTIRNKKTGKIYDNMHIIQFYEWQRFRQWSEQFINTEKV